VALLTRAWWPSIGRGRDRDETRSEPWRSVLKSAIWKAAPFGANQEAYLTVPVLPASGSFVQVAGRVTPASTTGVSAYFVRVIPSTSRWELRKKISGAASTVLRTFTAPFGAGATAAVQIAGSRITAYRKPSGGSWTIVGSATDSAITSGGHVGFTLGDTTVRGGAFGARTLP
jgi:hypothetical protein